MAKIRQDEDTDTGWGAFFDALLAAAGAGATDLAGAIAKVAPLLERIFGGIPPLRDAIPAGSPAWIVEDGAGDGTDTMDLAAFMTAVVTELGSASVPDTRGRGARTTRRARPAAAPPFDPVAIGAALATQIRAIEKVLGKPGIELIMRFAMQVDESLGAQGAASQLGRMLRDMWTMDEVIAAAGFVPSQPSDDVDKASQEKIIAALPVATAASATAASGWAGRLSADNSKELGNRVHRRVMAEYRVDHPDHLVVIDGGAYWQPGTPGAKTRLHQGLDALQSVPGDDGAARLAYYSDVMRDPSPPYRRIRPDIADLAPTAYGTTATSGNDHGWFEIKPGTNVVGAVEEVYGLYTVQWNGAPAATQLAAGWQPNWLALPGTWMPPLFHIDAVGGLRLVAKVTVLPGVIVYWSWEIDPDELAEVAAVVLAGILSLFANALGGYLRGLQWTPPEGQYPGTVQVPVQVVAAVQAVVVAWVVSAIEGLLLAITADLIVSLVEAAIIGLAALDAVAIVVTD